MKAASLTQPWATLVAIGAKTHETRNWPTKYRGPLAIHASRLFPAWAVNQCFEEPFYSCLRGTGLVQFNQKVRLPVGCMLATCELVDCVPTEKIRVCLDRDVEKWNKKDPRFHWISHEESDFGDYSRDRYVFVLANIKMLPEPVLVKGALGLWEWIPK